MNSYSFPPPLRNTGEIEREREYYVGTKLPIDGDSETDRDGGGGERREREI